MISDELKGLVDKALLLEKWPIARLVSVFETESEAASVRRQAVMEYLATVKSSRCAHILGMTGTPGAGKSSLIGSVCLSLLSRHRDLSIAVIAVDPSSQTSGGALLGDRTRTNFPVAEKRLYFRSQASALDLGGMSRKTFQVVRLLRKLFDLVIIETVGIGQSEIEVDHLSDQTLLVMQPLAGDQVQFMKAGIMEVPDAFVINKCDEDVLAQKSYHLLKSSLKLANIYVNEESQKSKPIYLTSVTKNKGIEELADHLLSAREAEDGADEFVATERFFLEKWVKEEFGNYGLGVCERYLTANAGHYFSFDQVLGALTALFRRQLPPLTEFD
ncbi:MAG: protein kinase [Proteobacteria bacterium]|nr:MAG: protein kinase [Pseudomonadota bacterium]PIE39990.1 MAG: protein kinase [Gammaproteobacteria bacterium]